MDGDVLGFAGEGDLESAEHRLLHLLAVAGQEVPARRHGAVGAGERRQPLGGVVRRVHAHRDHVRPIAERALDACQPLGHPGHTSGQRVNTKSATQTRPARRSGPNGAPVWSTSRKSGTVPRTGGGGSGVGSADRTMGKAITRARNPVQSQGWRLGRAIGGGAGRASMIVSGGSANSRRGGVHPMFRVSTHDCRRAPPPILDPTAPSRVRMRRALRSGPRRECSWPRPGRWCSPCCWCCAWRFQGSEPSAELRSAG